MKKLSIFFMGVMLICAGEAGAQLSGIVICNNVPVQGVQVCNTTKNACIKTDINGKFVIPAAANDEIQFAHPNFIVQSLQVTAAKLTSPELVRLERMPNEQSAPQAPSSSWIGAKIGYNFDGFDDDDNDFIGAAKIKLNLVDRGKDKYADYGVIGNIADFISKTNKEDADKDLQKLILSVTGLNIGMFGEWNFKKAQRNEDRKKVRDSGGKTKYERSEFSAYLTAGYRLNTFKYATPDSITVNLSQFKTSAGFQFEGIKFTEGGALNLSIEGSLYLFDPDRYEKIFNEKKKAIVSLEVGAIIPIKEKIGLFVSGTMGPRIKGVLLAGIIIKPE